MRAPSGGRYGRAGREVAIVTWRTTSDAAGFLAVAGAVLAADAVAHAPLLTEADFWRRTTTPLPGARGGWSADGGRLDAAFVHLPGHPPLCSRLGPGSVPGLLALHRSPVSTPSSDPEGGPSWVSAPTRS